MSTKLPVTLSGTVTRYKGDGRRLGYPTANIDQPTDLADGVYFGFADLANYTQRPALIFIGVPTTMGDSKRRIETHILDIPDDDYYGLEIAVRVHHFHRPNQTFASVKQLLEVMKSDEAAGRAWFKTVKLA
jgi:riboflavin kinase / FMN adenylyltransferase